MIANSMCNQPVLVLQGPAEEYSVVLSTSTGRQYVEVFVVSPQKPQISRVTQSSHMLNVWLQFIQLYVDVTCIQRTLLLYRMCSYCRHILSNSLLYLYSVTCCESRGSRHREISVKISRLELVLFISTCLFYQRCLTTAAFVYQFAQLK